MWLKSNTHNKTKPKLLTLILSLLLCLSMVVPIAITEPMTTYAAEGNVGGVDNDAKPENTTGGMGVSWNRTGWLVYISDVNGNLVTPVAFAATKTPPGDADKSYLYSRIGQTAPSLLVNLAGYPGWPLPVSSNGTNFAQLKSYMQQNVANVIGTLYGQSTVDLVGANLSNYYLCLDVVSWHARPGGTDTTVASHWGYVNMWADDKAQPYGKAFYPYNKCAVSEYIEKPWPGLPSPVTYLPSSPTACIPLETLQGAGYGMAAFRLDQLEGGPQTTADEPKIPTPHDPPNESTGIKTIIKNYRTINDTTNVTTDDGCTHRDNVDEHITVEEEGEYKVVGWKTSNTKNYSLDSITWPVPGKITQQGPTSGQVQLASPIETVLYVLLERHIEKEEEDPGKADFIISESTISRKIQLSKPDNSGISLVNEFNFTWTREEHKYKCTGHTYSWSQSCSTPGHGSHTYSTTHYCTFGKWNDNTMGQSLNNVKRSNYPTIVATKQLGIVSKTTGLSDNTKGSYDSVTTSTYTADTKTRKGWDYRCIIMRGKDKLTVAEWKNSNLGKADANSYLDGLSDAGFTVANSDSGTRKTKVYYDNFSVELKWDHSNKSTIYSSSATCGHGKQCGPNTKTYQLKLPYKADVGVRVETYAGSVHAGVNDTYCDSSPSSHGIFGGMPVLSGLNKVRGTEVQSGAILTFRPYIQMNYDKMAQNHQAYGASTSSPHLTAYVLGELDRTMTPNDYAEVSWKSRDWDKPNLTINSLQWSTHSSAVDFIGTKLGTDKLNKFTVLPGGATLDLTIKDSDRQKVVATTYQCVIEGTGQTQIDNAGGSYAGLTPTDAEASHKAYVESVKNGLDGIGVVQWITNDLSKVNGGNIESNSGNVWNQNNSSEVYWGVGLSSAGHSNQTASLETKYYLDDDGKHPEAPASEGDLDVEEKATTSKKYTFYINTFGEMYMIENNTSGNLNNEKAGTKINPGSLSGIAKQINDRTHVVDKLYKAVEKGTGNDPSGRSKTGTNWYNEAFDGITVYVQCTEILVGYIDPPQRSAVMDPKLTQTQDNQSDMFNKSKYNMSQYKTKNYSIAYEGTEEKVGEFKGESVYMQDMDIFFFSKQFFIPNATVDDLH